VDVECLPSKACEIGLTPQQVWELAVISPGFWSPSRVLVPTGTACAASLVVFPIGTLKAKVGVARGEQLPTRLEVRITPTPGGPVDGSFGSHEVSCTIAEGVVSCAIPAGTWDLRLRARGYVSHYRQGTKVAPASTVDLGALVLRRGASVVGSVVTSEGAASPRGCRVRLEPRVAAGAFTQEGLDRLPRAHLTEGIDARGFFQIAGVAEGVYRLIAEQEGFAPAIVVPVRVVADSETEITEPLVLQRPAMLALVVQPPVDPLQRPWHIEISQERQITGSYEEVAKGSCGAGGEFTQRGLAPGSYHIGVTDESGSRFLTVETEVLPGAPPMQLTVPIVRVEGEVLLGKEPLSALLRFDRRTPFARILAASDSSGRFELSLSAAGKWDVRVTCDAPVIRRIFRDVLVEPRDGLARLTLQVPDTHLRGTVTFTDGSPAAGAMVIGLHGPGGAFESRADDEGRFEFTGLEGQVLLSAKLRRGERSFESDLQTLSLPPSGRAPEVRLVVREEVTVQGRVIGGAGDAVAGAYVSGTPPLRSGQLSSGAEAVTGNDGSFSLRLPGPLGQLELVIMAPGHPLCARRVNSGSGEILVMLDRWGGDLVLEFPGVDLSDRMGPRVFLWQDGMPLDLGILVRWTHVQGFRPTLPLTRLEAPAMAPGRYRLCLIDGTALLLGSITPVGTCDEGNLGPLGSLTLEVSPPRSGR
jgi:hypothetical protein